MHDDGSGAATTSAPRLSLGDAIESPDEAETGAVLPSQLQSCPDWRHAASGEIALRQAILEDAIGCFQRQFSSQSQSARRLGREAEHWLFGDRRSWDFSFASVCEALGIEPRAIRRWLVAWLDAREARPRLRRTHMVQAQAGRRRRRRDAA